MNTIALFSDRTILPGTHVTLKTLLNSNSSGFPLNIVIFTNQLTANDKLDLYTTYQHHRSTEFLEIRDFRPPHIEGAHALHGNFMTYGRLFLAELLPDVDLCLYLDCDLAVHYEPEKLFNYFDSQHIAFADGVAKRKDALERNLFIKEGVDLDGDYFNAGVLGLNLKLWRAHDCTQRCKDLAIRNPNSPKEDQGLLNTLLADSCKSIGRAINTPLTPSTPSITPHTQDIIYHFENSPKPWDILGKNLHEHYALWEQHYLQTAIGHRAPWRYASLKRCLRLSTKTFCALRDKQLSTAYALP